MDHGRLKRLLEFFTIGLVFGVTEDILAVLIATDADLSADIVVVVVLIAIPFAVLSELVVDHPKFLHFDRLSMLLRSWTFGSDATHGQHMPGELSAETAPWTNHHYYCNICGREFETGALLGEHLDRVHPDVRINWWIHSVGPS